MSDLMLQGESKNTSTWLRSLDVIPGGNMLLTKNRNLYSPALWPTYYSKAEGCTVWDLDGRSFLDFTTNGVGCCTLGYSNQRINQSVSDAISKGVMCSLNTPLEVELAERLVSMHPWSDMVRFARSGGEANAIAIRIARAYTGKDKVVVCGYHGWHDWYLAANIREANSLNEHLLEGISPAGVPSVLAGSVQAIPYNSLSDLDILDSGDIGIMKMEVERNFPPAEGYLEAVRKKCNENNIVLIFDECTSGFREQFGGLYKKYGIEPDMCMFGKALGNGHAITAVLGRREIMSSACDSFISSTFWTESVGPAAALTTLDIMEECKSWEILPSTGTKIKDIWRSLADANCLPIAVQGIDAIPNFIFLTEKPLFYKTVFTEHMLNQGFLASTQFYATITHSDAVIAAYREAVESSFKYLAMILHEGLDIEQACAGPHCLSSFKRLN